MGYINMTSRLRYPLQKAICERVTLKNGFGPSCFNLQFQQDRSYSCLNVSRVNSPHQTQLGVRSIQLSSQRYRPDNQLDFFIFDRIVEGTTGYLDIIHDFTGLSGWCSAIVLAVFPLRFLLAIVMRKSALNSIVSQFQIQKEEKFLNEKLQKKLASPQWKKHFPDCKDKTEAHFYIQYQLKQQTQQLKEKQSASPARTIVLALLPLPLWVAMSRSLQIMAGYTMGVGWAPLYPELIRPSMLTGGCLWFPNLTVCDPHHILPFVAMAGFLTLLEVGNLQRAHMYIKPLKATENSKRIFFNMFLMKNIGRLWCLAAPILFWNAPASLQFYWASSSLIALVSNLILLHPKIEQRLLTPENREFAIKNNLINKNNYITIAENFKAVFRKESDIEKNERRFKR